MANDTEVAVSSDNGGGSPPSVDATPTSRNRYHAVTGARAGGDASGELTVVEPTYGFTLTYPEGFVVWRKDQPAESQFVPVPIAWFLVMNPTMAAGALAGIEPADLELRVFEIDDATTLEGWLQSVGLFRPEAGAAVQPYANRHVRGVKLCRSDMLVPPCSVFVLQGRRVYQLSAISQEGETMIEHFAATR